MHSPEGRFDASLNEVEQMAMKAARGAGLPWGLAEDAGRSAAFLAALGVEWAPSLVTLLAAPADRSALVLGPHWADLAVADGAWRTTEAAGALWLLPPLCAAARARHCGLDFAVDGLVLHAAPDAAGEHLSCDGDPAALHAALQAALAAGTARWRHGPPAPAGTVVALAQRSAVRQDAWHALEALALETCVPESARSRARGAGAGVGDED